MAVEDVVAEDQRDRSAPTKSRADDEGLGQAVGLRLHGIGEREAQLRAVAEQRAGRAADPRRRDDQDFANAGQHQRRQRIIDHRLVVDRQQLLGDDQGHRMQPRAGAAGQDDALHAVSLAIR